MFYSQNKNNKINNDLPSIIKYNNNYNLEHIIKWNNYIDLLAIIKY